MKIGSLTLALLFAVTVLTSCAGPAMQKSAMEPPLRILTEDYPPVTFVKDGKATGLGTEVVREILRRVSVPDVITVVPWSQGYDSALNQPNVVLFTMDRTVQRENLFKWVGPIGSNTSAFYAKKGSGIVIRSMDDAKKVKSIATCSSWFTEQMLRDAGFTNLVSSPLPTDNVKQLVEGRVQLSVFTDITIPSIARQAGYHLDDMEQVFPIQKTDFYIAFSKGTPDSVVQAWKSAFEAMKADGTFAAIYGKWVPGGQPPK